MEKGKAVEGEREERKANDSWVSFSAILKDIASVYDFIERLNNEEHQNDVDVYHVRGLMFELVFVCTYAQLSYCNLERLDDMLTFSIKKVKEHIGSIDLNKVIKYDMHHVLTRLMDNIDGCISSCARSKSSAAMTEEQLDVILQNLHHISKHCAELVYPLVSEYGILRDVCAIIRDLHWLKVYGYVKHDIIEHVLPQFQVMAETLGLFLWNDRRSGDSRLFKLAHLFLKIIPIELEVMQIYFTNLNASTSAEVGRCIAQLLETSPDILREYLIHLQEHIIKDVAASTSGARNVHVMIEFLLIIVTDMPQHFIHRNKFFGLLAHVGALTMKVSIIVRNIEEEKSSATLDLLEDIELLKGDLKYFYLKPPVGSSQLCFPKSDGPLFMHLLLGHLKDLLNSNAYSVALIKEEIELVKKDLEHVRSFFVNVEQYQFYKDLWARVLDVAYQTKDVIDSIIAGDNGLLHLIFSLPIATEKIKLIKEEVSNLSQEIPENKNTGLTVVNSPNKQPIESKSSIDDKIFVGFKEETELVIRMLTKGPKELDVISIIGMPGLGKTSLAYKIYNDKLVSSHFDTRAWCTVGQEHDKKKLLVDIFNQVIGSDSKVSENMDVVADKLRKHMFGKRYLIVLDDLWDIDAWDELTRPFPEVAKGCRIILTSRVKEVALHAKCYSDPLYLRLLKPEEICELFEKRVFGEENSCPVELLDVGKEIAGNCKGLPFVADLIASVLVVKEKKRTVWLDVRNNMTSLVCKNNVDVMKVIELSYNHLAYHLKLCLLYFAIWEKDTEIYDNWLISSWCAEGFIEQKEMKSVEEQAKVYLDNLISSSLVISFSEIRDYRFVQVHDLVHDFCLIKAKEEKLFDRISSSAQSFPLEVMPRKMCINYDEELFVLHPHLHDNFVMFDSKEKKHSGKYLYSLKIKSRLYNGRLYDRCHLRHLRLLRVLYLDTSFIKVEGTLLNEVCTLVHMRFLRIGTEVKSLPLSFSNLWNLETLRLENRGSPMVLLPTIWNLTKLRLLNINDCCFFDLDTDEPILIAEDSKLENLRTLWGLQLSYSNDTEDIFKRFPNLQQLGLKLMESWDCSTGRYWFPKLDFLNELEELYVYFISDKESSNSNNSGPSVAVTSQWDFHFPSSLKGLKLFMFPLTSDSLSTIARLPSLEKLFLEYTIIEGGEWNMGEEDTFKNLKLLRLWVETLEKWEVGEESFPVIERLELKECHKLEEIPPAFGDIESLKSIKLISCPPHLEESALKMKQDVEEMTGNDKLKVLVLDES